MINADQQVYPIYNFGAKYIKDVTMNNYLKFKFKYDLKTAPKVLIICQR